MIPPMSEGRIYTIGHSTRPLDEFIKLLRAYGVEQLADIRTMPRSRRHPHFSREALSGSLPDAGVRYRHFAELGGLRKARADSSNSAWRHPGFRGYADYMETPAFAAALDELVAFSREAPTAIMCAEAIWWRCHRQLVADALVARGIEVLHITSATAARRHTLTDFAQLDGERVVYRGLI
jgi:uncharacterized protein (DUF488 family)